METVKGRGICCGNEVYFDYVDGEVVMTMYRDMPGVRMDRRSPNVIKSFSVGQWGDINKYLGETLDKFEGVFSDDEDVAGDDVIEIDSKGGVHPPEAVSILSEIQQLRKGGTKLPKMGNAEAILPENKVPAMTKSELEKEENGEEIDESNGKEETSP